MHLETVLKMPDRAEAFIELVRLLFYGDDAERDSIVKNWNFGVDWVYPNQTRLACNKKERWSSQTKIEASLAYFLLETKHESDYRENLIALAVIYQSCIAADLDARIIFEKIAKYATPRVKDMFANFLMRKEEDKSLAAFMLMAEKNEDGEIEIRFEWNMDK